MIKSLTDNRPPFSSIGGLIPENFHHLPTPCYVLDEGKPLVTNARQKEALMRAEEALVRAEEAYGMPQDLLSIDIRQAFEDLGDVNGSTSSDEIVTEIFSRFCLGK